MQKLLWERDLSIAIREDAKDRNEKHYWEQYGSEEYQSISQNAFDELAIATL